MANSLSRQIRQMVEAAEQQGFRVKETRKGWLVYPADTGVSGVLMHKTPSDPRGVKNARAMLRRIGVDV